MRKMVLQNSHLLTKKYDDGRFNDYPPVETWSFDLFLPSEAIEQDVEFGMVR